MKIITIIGTRPQYIKIKPFYDYCKNNNIHNHIIIDTNQHYANNISKNLIKELELNIDYNLRVQFHDDISFMSNSILSISNIFKKVCDIESTVVVVGDTNSTLISSIVAKKMGLKLAHIEAGVRCHNMNSPEEINRVIVDSITDIHFISREIDAQYVSNPVYIGDLEYNFLNNIESGDEDISYHGHILMTIHRQENLFKDRLECIFKFCEDIDYPILFPIHHRTKKFVEDSKILISKNVRVVDPMSFFEIMKVLRDCRGIITDSGGLTKTSPFFGKKCIVPMNEWEWNEVFELGYATNELNKNWFDDYKMKRKKDLYYINNSCEIIINKILER